MKKYIVTKTIITGFLTVALFFSSCSKFTEISPQYSIDSENYFNSENDYYLALVATYDLLQTTYANNILGEIASNNTLCGGESPNDVIGWQQVDDMIHTPTNSNLQDIWGWMFAGIQRANYFMEFRDKIDFEGKDVMIGEVRFLRAYYHFELVKWFGPIPLKPNADEALKDCDSIEHCIVVERAGNDINMTEGRDSFWAEEVTASDISSHCEPESMDAEDILFILYTSGSTGKPKGVVHTTGGYLTYAMHTCQWVFDLKDDDVYWCTADIGWITGHSYILYGPLGLGATSVMFEGVPSYPGPDRFWKIVEKFQVNTFYTAPTVIRALMRDGEEPTQRYDLSSLRILGSVGEPINPEAWMWYHTNIGKSKLPIVDTWWQTETGGLMIHRLYKQWKNLWC